MGGAIGFFDSGVGGVSVMKRAHEIMPGEDFIFFGDNKNAPYGEKTREEILRLTRAGVAVLTGRGIKALVIACNTATGVAVAELRSELEIPVVAMEPALKPAYEMRSGGQIIVIATSAALRQRKFAELYEKYGEGAVCVAGTGLVELIEAGDMQSPAIDERLRELLGSALLKKTDAIVLGCTHYNFIKDAVRRVAGEGVAIIDAIDGTVRQLRHVLESGGMLSPKPEGGAVEFLTSGGSRSEALIKQLFYEGSIK